MSLGAVTTLGEDFSAPDDALRAELARREAAGRAHEGRGAHRDAVQGPARPRRRGHARHRGARARRASTARCAASGASTPAQSRSSVPARASCWRAAASSGTARWCARSSATTSSRCRRRTTSATGSSWPWRPAGRSPNMNSYWGQPAMFDPGIDARRRAGAAVRVGSWRAGLADRQRPRRAVRQRVAAVQRLPEDVRPLRPDQRRVPQRSAGVDDLRPADASESVRIMSMHARRPGARLDPAADDRRELADKIGIDPDALEATVARFNEHAARRRRPRLLAHDGRA